MFNSGLVFSEIDASLISAKTYHMHSEYKATALGIILEKLGEWLLTHAYGFVCLFKIQSLVHTIFLNGLSHQTAIYR